MYEELKEKVLKLYYCTYKTTTNISQELNIPYDIVLDIIKEDAGEEKEYPDLSFFR